MAYTTIDDPSAHFQTKAYSGSGTTQSITNDGNSDLQPDWVWIKSRDGTYDHEVVDSNRGTTKYLYPNLTTVENTSSSKVTSFNSDGFTLNSQAGSPFNSATNTYVAWQWKANGGTTSTNTDGAITSTVQVNSDAGFSILTYTMGSGNETVGHGLGVTPKVIIYKARFRGDANGFWAVYTTVIDGSLDYLTLNTTNAKSDSSLAAPTSTVFTGAGSGTVAYRDFVAYCFAEKQGYSKFGKYNGLLGSTRPVYTGFKPAFVMIKRTDSTTNAHWIIMDSERGTYNSIDSEKLYANVNNTEASLSGDSTSTDFYSNGFRITGTYTGVNSAGATYFYMAFAENPFVTSTGVPCTAR